jgi:hypothetical protein
MDQTQFDRIARLLGKAISRRAGIGAVVAALTGSQIAADADGKRKGKGKGSGSGKPGIEGPCGNGKRKANICTKNSQCCTGICEVKLGKKNRDGQGRCRCVRKGGDCTADKNCCGGRSCVKGVCGDSPPSGIPNGGACTSGDVCRDPDATCTNYCSRTPSGTYCLKANTGTCSAGTDCKSHNCAAGACASEVCTVCSTCTYTTLDGAIAGATSGDELVIAAGTWPVDMTNTATNKSLTLRACDCGEVVLTPPVNPGGYGTMLKVQTTQATDWALIGLTIDMQSTQNWTGLDFSGSTTPSSLLIDRCTFKNAKVDFACRVVLDGTVTVTDSVFKDGNTGSGFGIDGYTSTDPTLAVVTMTNCQVMDNTNNNRPGLYFGGVTATVTDCTISGNVLTNASNAGAGVMSTDTVLTLAGSTVIQNNQQTGSGGGGGGLYFNRTNGYGGGLTVEQTVRITGNSAAEGSGVVRRLGDQVPTALGGINTTTVTGNTGGDECEELTGASTYTPVVNCIFA